jgi:hypothetical protein
MTRPKSKLDDLEGKERKELIQRLYERQGHLCYICGKDINLQLDELDIDHILSITKGLDEEQNWALTHSRENRSKGNRDLQLLQHIFKYRMDKEDFLANGNDFTVGNALEILSPKRQEVIAKILDGKIQISYLDDYKKSTSEEFPLINDGSERIRSFTGFIPFSCIFHDPTINPRSILDLEPMIEEFYDGNPQLQPSLAILQFEEPEGKGKILLFDGQHKAAAQLYLRNSKLFTRVFVNADKDKIKQANFRAHTVVAQIHFPDFIQDKVGHDLFKLEFDSYRDTADESSDSEEKFIQNSDGSNDYRQYLYSYLKYEALFGGGQKHKILNYVETIIVRSKKFPLSYDTLDKTFLKFFLYLKPSKDPLHTSIKLRETEKKNIGILMNIFVEEILDKKFDISKGTFKIEEKLYNDPNSVDGKHLSAYRICRRPAMVVWVEELQKAIVRMLKTRNKYDRAEWAENRVIWAEMDEKDWKMIRGMLQVVQEHQIWVERHNKTTIQNLASTKQRDWKEMLLDGKLPGRTEKLFDPLTDTQIYDRALGKAR